MITLYIVQYQLVINTLSLVAITFYIWYSVKFGKLASSLKDV